MIEPKINDKKYYYYHKKLGKKIFNCEKFLTDCKNFSDYTFKKTLEEVIQDGIKM